MSPTSARQIARIALPKDYVRLRLCGEHATDVSDASGTLLLDVAARRWSDEVVERAGARPGGLPPRAREPGGIRARPPGGVPVAAGAGDQAAGALGVGVDRPGPVSVVLGTSGVVFAALERVSRPTRRARARVLPRRPRCLARDGRDAVGRRLAALARADAGARRVEFDDAAQRGRGAGRRAPRG